MTTCCTTNKATRHICPVNGKHYPEVKPTTLLHQLKRPWEHPVNEKKYYFCEDPDCEVVYFSEDDNTLTQAALRSEVGCKTDSPQSLVCYCFGITQQQAIKQPELKEFVIQQTKLKQCACTERNPSGRCCLKDFPDIKELQ